MIDRQTVYQHGAAVQESQPIQFPKFPPGLFVNSFARMDNKGPPFGGGGARLAKVAAKRQRMAPSEFPDHSHREILSLQLRPKRIVVTDCCDSAEKVSYSAPPKANLFRHTPIFRNCVWKSLVYVLPPFDVIPIRRISQPGEEREFQMIVRIDEARQ